MSRRGWIIVAVLFLLTMAPVVAKKIREKGLVPFTLEGHNVRESLATVHREVVRVLSKTMSEVVVLLGTLIASEAGSLPRAGMVGVGWATLNMATGRKAAGMTREKREAAVLKLVGRELGEQGGVRWYAATSRPPTKTSIEVADEVLDLRVADPTGGAIQWDSPEAQRALHKRDPKRYRTPEEIASKRISVDKRELRLVAGVSADKTRFWA